MITRELTSSATPASVDRTSHWIEVVSHLDPKYGGLSATVPALAQAVQKTGINVALAAFCDANEDTAPTGFHKDDTQHLTFWPASRKAWIADSKSLVSRFEQVLNGAQGVHIHGLWEQSTAIAATTSRRLKLPYVLSAHGMLEPWALGNKRLKKILYSAFVERSNIAQASCLHALTHAEAQQYRSFGARQPIAVIPNAVQVPADADANLFVESFPALRGKRLVLYLGRIHRKKGLHLLLEAWKQLKHHDQNHHLVIAGPDSDNLQAELEAMVREWSLEGAVTFVGMLQHEMKWSALAASTAFVLPSHSEGLSVSVLEAMGMGLPVIISRACNMPEVETLDAGWQIEPTSGSLVQALIQLFESTAERNQERGARGMRLIKSRYTWPVVASQMAAVYKWLQGGPFPVHTEILTMEGGLSQ